MPITERQKTAVRCLGGSARTAAHSSGSELRVAPAVDDRPSGTSSTGTGLRPRARWESIAFRWPILSSQPRRLSARRALGYARRAEITVSWKQSSASLGPTEATRKRYRSAWWASRSTWNGGRLTPEERRRARVCEIAASAADG